MATRVVSPLPDSLTVDRFLGSLSPQGTVVHDRLRTMLHQEETLYKIRYKYDKKPLDSIGTNDDDTQTPSTPGTSSNEKVLNDLPSPDGVHNFPHQDAAVGCSNTEVTELLREKICEWSYKVVDHFEICRETVAISLNILDRFLEKVTCNEKEFQLAAITTLNIAIKIHETTPINLKSFVELSNGHFTVENIVCYECFILRTLSWHVRPPTPISFVRNFMLILPPTISPKNRSEILDFSSFVLELAVCDYSLATCRPSYIAFASILNAFDELGPDSVALDDQFEFLDNIFSFIGVTINSEVIAAKLRLERIYEESNG